jgi:hypothetical protein
LRVGLHAAGGAAGGAGQSMGGGPAGVSVSTASFISLALRGFRPVTSQRAARLSSGSAPADNSAAEQLLELSALLWEGGGAVLTEPADAEDGEGGTGEME